MAWGGSGIFTQTVADIFANTTALDMTGDTINLALYNNSVTPDYDAAAASAAYNAGTWVTGNEVTGTNWAAKGVVLGTPTLTTADPAAGQLSYDAVNVSEANTTVTNFYGCLIFSDTIATPVADQAICAIDFGQAYSTVAGTLAINFDANGIFYIDLVP